MIEMVERAFDEHDETMINLSSKEEASMEMKSIEF